MEKEMIQNEIPVLEEMLSLMTEQQELIVEITGELQAANQDLKAAQEQISERNRQMLSLKRLVRQLNDENERLMKL